MALPNAGRFHVNVKLVSLMGSRRIDPRGRKYYWIGGEPPHWHPGEGTDFEAVQGGYVSITPLHLDLTHHESIQRLKPLEELLGGQ